ncbi:MAG TPA: YkgJ family cysteine cluster protein [Draconibacterium sp.]|nr:YkgJ family cysteine cluster protein [Draconibacterium sp.]
MDNNQSFDKLLKAFYSDGFSLGMAVFISDFNPKKLFKSILHMHNSVDSFILSFNDFVTKNGKKIHCKKGCSWCCHQPVFALSYELDYLNNYISKHFDKQKQDEIRKRAKAKKQKLNSLGEKDILNSKFPCPLLENGACTAYEVRPMACRIYLSTNVKTCLDFFHKPEDKKSIPALLDFPMRAGRMMNEGFKAALNTNGMKIQEFRIEEKLAEKQFQ